MLSILINSLSNSDHMLFEFSNHQIRIYRNITHCVETGTLLFKVDANPIFSIAYKVSTLIECLLEPLC